MWRRSDIDENQRYRLALIQHESRAREFVLQNESMELVSAKNILYTEIVPNELLIKGNLEAISKSVFLINGGRFYVDPHNIWITEIQMEAWLNDDEPEIMPWLNGLAPRFAEK